LLERNRQLDFGAKKTLTVYKIKTSLVEIGCRSQKSSSEATGRALSRAKPVLGEQSDLGKEAFRNRIHSVRCLARQVREAMRRGGEAAQVEGKKAYPKLLRATRGTIQQAKNILSILQA
jgi:hypothetical protein